MAFYRQGPRTTPGSGPVQGWGRDWQPRSRNAMGPALVQPNLETQTRWTPWGTFQPQPYFGRWDGLRGRLTMVTQADFFDSSPNPWPSNGVDDQPGAGIHARLVLARENSIHRAPYLQSQPQPAMVFRPPPIFGLQTTPIMAVGV